MSFIKLHFLGKMALLALGDWHPQPLKKALSKSKGSFFSSEMNAINDTKTWEMAISAKETGNICDRLTDLSRHG